MHLRAGLGAKVLHDDFLNVPVAIGELAQGEQRVEALAPRFADADQNAARHRHTGFTGEPQRLQAARRAFVGRTEMRAASFAQPVGCGFEHDAHRRRHASQSAQVLGADQARIEMRKKAGFAQHQSRDVLEVVERRRETQLRQRLARTRVAQLRLIAEREQHFLAAERSSCACDREDIFSEQDTVSQPVAASCANVQ